MRIKRRSYFKNNLQDIAQFNDWVSRLERVNDKIYENIFMTTSLGTTKVWGLNTENKDVPSLVIFPGARTTPLFWDFDNNLQYLSNDLRIYLVETNGLPNNSDGNTPDIKSLDYGHWAAEVLDNLNLKQTYIAGASFGGLICMKLAITNPNKIKAAFLLNPGCLQPFSMKLSNLYYNLLPILFPSKKNVRKFLDKAVFSKPHHSLSVMANELIVDYELFALTRYKDNTQKPYYMNDELLKVKADTYLLVGDKDLLFPYQKSIENAKRKISSLKDVVIYGNVGHGIETYSEAIRYIHKKITA